MNKTKNYPRVLTSIALIFCMLFGLVSVSNAAVYKSRFYPSNAEVYKFLVKPLGSNSRTTFKISPERYTFQIYISDGKSGSSLKKDTLPGWITVNSSNSDYYVATISANTGTSVRSGSIVFTKGSNKYEFYLTQNPFTVQTTTSEAGPNVSSLSFKVAGETKQLYSFPCSLSGNIPDWLTVTQSGNNTCFTLKAKPNINGSIRKCTLKFTMTLSSYEKVTRTVTITQSANSLTGVPSTLGFPKTRTDKTFTVTTGYGTAKATVKTGYNWIEVFQTGNKITVRCNNNITKSARTGYVYVTIGNISKTIKVTQAKGDGIPGPTPVLPG